MNRILIPLLILLWSLLYSWFWNCERRPHCAGGEYVSNTVVAPPQEVKIVEPDTMTVAKTAEEELLFMPLDVYFETAKSSIANTQEIDNFLTIAKEYLVAHPDQKLSIVGHTDNDGTDATNDPLSLKRANLVKDFLVQNGFSSSQMTTSGMGKREPIAANDTPEGRAKNRRVTIRLAE